MEVTAFIIELSAEVVKGIQGGNECWTMNNGKLRGEVVEGMVRGEGLLSFCNGCEGDSIRCNGRGKQGKDA